MSGKEIPGAFGRFCSLSEEGALWGWALYVLGDPQFMFGLVLGDLRYLQKAFGEWKCGDSGAIHFNDCERFGVAAVDAVVALEWGSG